MWEPLEYADLKNRLKKLIKRNKQEVINVFDNLNAYLEALRSGLSPQQIVRGWVHAEPKGLKAIDETGPNKPRKAIRLYVYPEEDTQILHALTIGDKNTQSTDIKRCEEFVEELLAKKASATSQIITVDPQPSVTTTNITTISPHSPSPPNNAEDRESDDQANQQAAG